MITIEKVDVTDAKELLDIYSYYVEETAVSFEYEAPSLDEFEERIKHISEKYPYIKAVEDNRILGYAYATTFKGRCAYDWSVETTIYIKRECRQRGIGKVLYSSLEKILADMGVLNLNACIAVPNGIDEHLTDGSIKFHEYMGYSLVGTFHDSGYKFDKWYDMIWMEKMIGNHTTNQIPVCFGNWDI